MNNNNELLTALNALLAEKLTAINQFMVHSEMCDNLGYHNLHKTIQNLATDQMILAEWLIERISFLEGSLTLPSLQTFMIEKTITEMVSTKTGREPGALHKYAKAIELARLANDYATSDLLNNMLQKDNGQLDWAELQRIQIEEKGLKNYLIAQAEYMVN